LLRERSCARGEKRGGKKRGSADLLAKEQRAASETQRDFAALKKSKKSDFAAKTANSADLKFCAYTYSERKILHARFCGL
jgi:methylated-DNA--protein-cysteine methyltransferase 1